MILTWAFFVDKTVSMDVLKSRFLSYPTALQTSFTLQRLSMKWELENIPKLRSSSIFFGAFGSSPSGRRSSSNLAQKNLICSSGSWFGQSLFDADRVSTKYNLFQYSFV